MGIYNIQIIEPVSTENFILNSEGDNLVLTFSDGYNQYDNYEYLQLVPDLQNFQYNSILIGGLGLGIISQYIALNTSCETIDVLEIDPVLISTITDLNILDTKINVIEGDIFEYIPVQNYDLILLNIWRTGDENFGTVVENLRVKYNPYLTQNGIFYVPIFRTKDIYPKI